MDVQARVPHPYLRVVAGFFAAVFVWATVGLVVEGEVGAAVFALIVAAALGWYAAATPLRMRARRVRARQQAMAARADAGHRAYLSGDIGAAMAPPPPVAPVPPVRRGVKAAIAVAVALFVMVMLGSVVGEEQGSGTGTSGMGGLHGAGAAPGPADGRDAVSAVR